MKWSYEYKNQLPANHFAICDVNGVCRLPIFDIRGRLDPIHLRNAISRLARMKLPDERIRSRVHNSLEDLLDRMNAGEIITADEWTPISPASVFANARRNPDYDYEPEWEGSEPETYAEDPFLVESEEEEIELNPRRNPSFQEGDFVIATHGIYSNYGIVSDCGWNNNQYSVIVATANGAAEGVYSGDDLRKTEPIPEVRERLINSALGVYRSQRRRY